MSYPVDSSRWFWLRDSYRHYRQHVGLSRLAALYRAVYYEVRKKEPYA